jgi:DNA-binding response OmpR family regulator
MNDQAQHSMPARHSIMLVDDDARVRRLMTLLLRLSGAWEVVGEAADCATAISLSGALQPSLVLLDMRLPDGDGLSLLPRLRALAPAPLVVILTAEPADNLREQALALGAADYLWKMEPPDELLARLRALMS